MSYVWEVPVVAHAIILTIGGTAVVGVIASLLVIGRVLRVPLVHTIALAIAVLVLGAILARVVYLCGVAGKSASWADLLWCWKVWKRGLSIFGFILAPAVILYLTRCAGFRIPSVDRLVGASYLLLPAGQSVGRIACFLNGCCYGRPTGVNAGVVYSPRTFAGLASGPIALHPVQLYESALDLVLFVGLVVVWRKTATPERSGPLSWVLWSDTSRHPVPTRRCLARDWSTRCSVACKCVHDTVRVGSHWLGLVERCPNERRCNSRSI